MAPFLMAEDQPFLHRAKEPRPRARSTATVRGNAYPFKGMSVETSRYYRADLGQLDESTQRIFQAWADSQPHGHYLVQDKDGKFVLYAEREDERQKKSHMAALRTTINNWKIPIQLPPGFLLVLSEAEFRAALATLTRGPPIAEPTAIESSTSVHLPNPAGQDMERVLSLSPDFDDRARALLMELRGCGPKSVPADEPNR